MRSSDILSERSVSFEKLIPLIKERIAAGQSVRFSPRGSSMLPMLREGVDSVVLSPVPDKLEKYDLPLYQRENGKYILHRVVEVGETYTCMGDNQFVPEPGIRHEQMIALVTSFSRGSKEYGVHGMGYRLYCWIWYHSRHLRRFIHRGLKWLKSHHVIDLWK